jgi:hypothetical protein
MFYIQMAFAVVIPVVLAWVFFRYLIRLVKSHEAIADNLEEISHSLIEISESLNDKNTKPENEN